MKELEMSDYINNVNNILYTDTITHYDCCVMLIHETSQLYNTIITKHYNTNEWRVFKYYKYVLPNCEKLLCNIYDKYTAKTLTFDDFQLSLICKHELMSYNELFNDIIQSKTRTILCGLIRL